MVGSCAPCYIDRSSIISDHWNEKFIINFYVLSQLYYSFQPASVPHPIHMLVFLRIDWTIPFLFLDSKAAFLCQLQLHISLNNGSTGLKCWKSIYRNKCTVNKSIWSSATAWPGHDLFPNPNGIKFLLRLWSIQNYCWFGPHCHAYSDQIW